MVWLTEGHFFNCAVQFSTTLIAARVFLSVTTLTRRALSVFTWPVIGAFDLEEQFVACRIEILFRQSR